MTGFPGEQEGIVWSCSSESHLSYIPTSFIIVAFRAQGEEENFTSIFFMEILHFPVL